MYSLFLCVYHAYNLIAPVIDKWASACDFQQFDILTSVDSDEPVQPPFKLRNSKWRSVSSFTIIEYSRDKQRLWSDCAYAQAGLRLCWSHISNCWKSHALAQMFYIKYLTMNRVQKNVIVWLRICTGYNLLAIFQNKRTNHTITCHTITCIVL